MVLDSTSTVAIIKRIQLCPRPRLCRFWDRHEGADRRSGFLYQDTRSWEEMMNASKGIGLGSLSEQQLTPRVYEQNGRVS